VPIFDAATDTPAGPSGLAAADKFIFGRVSPSGWETMLAGDVFDALVRVTSGGRAGALNLVLPAQTGQAGKFLRTDGTDAAWTFVSVPVTSVAGRTGDVTLAVTDVSGAAKLSDGNTFTGQQLANVTASPAATAGWGVMDAGTLTGRWFGNGSLVLYEKLYDGVSLSRVVLDVPTGSATLQAVKLQAAGVAADAGLARSSAGVVKVTDGSTGDGSLRVGGVTVNALTAGTVPLTLNLSTAQTAAAFSVYHGSGGPLAANLTAAGGLFLYRKDSNSVSTVKFGFNPASGVGFMDSLVLDAGNFDTTVSRNSSGTAGGLYATTTVTGADLLTLQGPASQTGHYLNLKNAVGTSLFRVEYRDADSVKLAWKAGQNLYLGNTACLRAGGGGGSDGTALLSIEDIIVGSSYGADAKFKFLKDTGSSPLALLASHALLSWGAATNLGGSLAGDTTVSRNSSGTAGGLLATTTVTGADILTLQFPASATGRGLVLKNSVGTVLGRFTHDGTTGYLTAESGNLVLNPGGSVYVNQQGHIQCSAVVCSGAFYLDGADGGDFRVTSAGTIRWGSSGGGISTLDTGLARSSAGVLKVTNGSTGYGSLVANGLTNGNAGEFTVGTYTVDGIFNLGTFGSGTYTRLDFYCANARHGRLSSNGGWEFGAAANTMLNVSPTGVICLPSSSSEVALTLQLAASQTGNAMEVKNSVGTSKFYVDANGGLRANGASVFADSIQVYTDIYAWKGIATVSAGFIQWSSDGNVYSAPDLGITRPAASVMRVTAGWAGYGDLQARALFVNKNSAPADGELAAGQLALWFDSTNGASLAGLKGKSADGTVVTAALSGTNTGDQTITLSGDVSGSGTAGVVTTIGAGKVTNAMLAGAIDLAAKVAGLLPGANGGTGEDNSAGGTANTFWARPDGSTGAAAYRAIVAADVPTLNQSTTGSAATLTTPRAIYGNNFDGSAALAQVIASTYGGTGNGFTKFSGPTTAEKTFTLPDASATVLTTNAAVTAAQGGTGQTTYATGDTLYASASNTLGKLSGNTTTTRKFLRQTGNGSVSAAPAWDTLATGDMPAGVPTAAATQAEQEAGSSTTVYATPGRQHYHPAAAKAWVTFSVSGGVVTLRSNYNVTSVTRNSAGNFTVNFTNALSAAANICAVGSAGLSGSRLLLDLVAYASFTTGSVQVITATDAGTLTDPDVCCVAVFGDMP
jgi:hypothetical protein